MKEALVQTLLWNIFDMKRFTLLILILLFAVSCTQNEFVPENGDLVFCVGSQGNMSSAITDATTIEGALEQLDHVGIISIEGDSVFVLEANPQKGVVATPLSQFLKESYYINGAPGIIVKRLNIDFDKEKTVERAKSFIGEPYDWSYLPQNGKVYCSELVYQSFINDDGTPVFQSKPMSFRDSEGNIPQFWIDLFKSLGEEIPEGVAGTNPNDMSQEEILTEVYRYFKYQIS